MPFMKGRVAYRNTLQYLKQGKIVFKPEVKVMAINYNIGKLPKVAIEDTSAGVRNLVFWHLNQIQYKNPQVQIVTLKNMTPSPFITFFMNGNKKMIVDVESKSTEDILSHIRQVLGKTEEELIAEQRVDDTALFGFGKLRQCICEVPGQVPCPGYVPLPKHMTGKYKIAVARGDIEDGS